MNIAGSFLFLLTVFTINYSQIPTEQQAQVNAVFGSFDSSLADLRRRLGKKPPRGTKAEIAQSLESISENVEFLKKVMMTPGRPILKEYLEGVAADAELLQELAAQNPRTAPELKALNVELKEVASDLTLKITGPRSGGEIVRLVEVFVHARKGTETVGGYQVIYVSRAQLRNKTYYKPFDRLTDPSNPTSMKLPPGNYIIWLKKDMQETKQQPASVGENQESKKTIDVPVP